MITPPITLPAATLAEVQYPAGFVLVDSVQPDHIASGAESGYKWYFVAFGAFGAEAQRLCYVFTWLPGQIAEAIPLEKYTTARGSLSLGAFGAGLWLAGHDTGKPTRTFFQKIQGWAPAPWMLA